MRKIILKPAFIKNPVPAAYRWDGEQRFISPQGSELNGKEIKDIQCPKCRKNMLDFRDCNFLGLFPGVAINCVHCDWVAPIPLEECPDETAAMVEFKEWLEAYELAGSDPKFLTIDTRVFLNPDDEVGVDPDVVR